MRASQLWGVPEDASCVGGVDMYGAELFPPPDERLSSSSYSSFPPSDPSRPPASFRTADSFASPAFLRSSHGAAAAAAGPRMSFPGLSAPATAPSSSFFEASGGGGGGGAAAAAATPVPATAAPEWGADGSREVFLRDSGWTRGAAAAADFNWPSQVSLWTAFFKQCCLWPPLQVVGCMYTVCACLACAIAAQQLPLSRAADVSFPTLVSVAAFLGCLVCRSFLLTPPSQALKAAAAGAEGPAAVPLLLFTSRRALPLLLTAAVLHAAAAVAASTLLLHLLLPGRPSLQPLVASFEFFFVYPFAVITALLHAYRFAVRRRWLLVLSSPEVPAGPILLPQFFAAAAVEVAAALLVTLLLLPLLVPAAAAAPPPLPLPTSSGHTGSSSSAGGVSGGSSRTRRPRVSSAAAAAEWPSAAVVFSSVYASLSPLFSAALASPASAAASAARSSGPRFFPSEEQQLPSRRRRRKTKREPGYAARFLRWLQLLLTLVLFVPRYCLLASSAVVLLLLSCFSSLFLLLACVCGCCVVQAFLLLLLNVHQELQQQTAPTTCNAVTAACAQTALGGAWPIAPAAATPTAAATARPSYLACSGAPIPRLSVPSSSSFSTSSSPLMVLSPSSSNSTCYCNILAQFSPPRTGTLFDQQCLMLRWLHDCASALQLWWDVGCSNSNSSSAATSKGADCCCCCCGASSSSASPRSHATPLEDEYLCNVPVRCIDANTFFCVSSPSCCRFSSSALPRHQQHLLLRSRGSADACAQWHQKGLVASTTCRQRLPLTHALLEFFIPAAARSGFPLLPVKFPMLRRSSSSPWWGLQTQAPAGLQGDLSRAATDAAARQRQQQQQQMLLDVRDSSSTSLRTAAAVVMQQMLSQRHRRRGDSFATTCPPSLSLSAAYEAVVRGALLHYMRLLRTLQQLQQGLVPFPSTRGGWKQQQQQLLRESAAAAATIEAAKAEAAADAAAAAAAGAAAEAGRAAEELRRRRWGLNTSTRKEEASAVREREQEELQQRAAAAAGAAAAAALSAAAAPALAAQQWPWWFGLLPTKLLLFLQQNPTTNRLLRSSCRSSSNSGSDGVLSSSNGGTREASSSSRLLTTDFGLSSSGAVAAAAEDASRKRMTGCWWILKSLLCGADNDSSNENSSSSSKGFWESSGGAALQLEICVMAGVCACAVEGLAMWLCAAAAAAKENAAAAAEQQQLAAATGDAGRAETVPRSSNWLTAAGASAYLRSGTCEAAAQLTLSIAEVLQHELRVQRNATVAAKAASVTLHEEVRRAMNQFTRRGKKAIILMRRYEPLRLHSLCTGATAAKTKATLSPQAFEILRQLLSLPCGNSPL